jgi:hypothetical protein
MGVFDQNQQIFDLVLNESISLKLFEETLAENINSNAILLEHY